MPEQQNTVQRADDSNPFAFWLTFWWELLLMHSELGRMTHDQALQRVAEFNARFGSIESAPQEEN